MTLERFHWKSPDGVEITLPRATQLPFGLLRRIRKMEELDALFEILDEAGDEKTIAQIDALTIGDGQRLAQEWLAELGEVQPPRS